MRSKPFEHAKTKVVRARKFISEAEQAYTEFLAQNPYVVTLHEQRIGKQQKISMSLYTRKVVPPCVACIIGDAIHNLRVALDVCANDLVALNNVAPKGVYFPFGKNEAHFDDQMKDKMKGAHPNAKALVKELKPWSGGNDALRALHDLDIVDKHSAPLSTVTSVSSPDMKVGEVWVGYSKTLMINTELLKPKLKPVDQSLFAEPQQPPMGFTTLGMYEGANHTLIFSKGLPLSGEPVIESLCKLAQLIDGIIESFEEHFLRRKP